MQGFNTSQTMATPNHAVMVTLAPEHWLRIQQALKVAELQAHRDSQTNTGWQLNHTRQLIQHVTAGWEVQP